MKAILLRLRQWLQRRWKRILMYGGGGLLVLLVLVQLLYPQDRLVLNATVDGVEVGGWKKDDAVWQLNHHYLRKSVNIYFGDNKTAYRSPVVSEIGMTIDNTGRIADMRYPWWLRLMPSSLIWAHHFISPDTPPTYEVQQATLDGYVAKELGRSCNVAAIDADITYADKQLTVVPSMPGGTCEVSKVTSTLTKVKPTLLTEAAVRIPMKEVKPVVQTAEAQEIADDILRRIDGGIPVKAGEEMITVPAEDVMGWMDFTVKDGQLTLQLSSQRANEYLTKTIAPKVFVAPGLTKITTRDFAEVSRQDGRSGQTVDVDATLRHILTYINKQADDVAVATTAVAPRVEYTRTYSPTDEGLNALLANYAKDHSGTFGISLIELSGERRRANYNEDKSFVTASTYKLFVAYSTLKRVDAGVWHWNDVDIATGRNLAACFDDMIVKSDNACAEAMLKKIGYREITNEVHALGLTNTSFVTGDTPQSTAGDEALFLAQLESKQLPLSSESRNRLLDAMKRNVFRQGIPAGANGTVANKVGFLWGLLHDAAVVYSPNGTYVLVIMTDGSSWGAIADLTREIESLRTK